MSGSAASGIIGAPAVTARLLDSLDDLPPAADALFAGAPFQSSAAWWRCCIEAALPAQTRPVFALCVAGKAPIALLPLLAHGRHLSSLTTPYTCLYQPLLAAGLREADLQHVGAALGRALRAWPTLRLDALDADWAAWPALLRGLRAAGWRGYRFAAFGNWHAPVAGQGWTAYLAGRPGALRETIRRKQRKHGASLRLDVARTVAEAAEGLAAYEAIYAQSWKQPEPFPAFNAVLLRCAADLGVLRLGVLRHQGVPLAAQYWIVEAGTASVLKLAHLDDARALSPGTLLTAMMIRDLLEQDGVQELDFGRGDDAYKQSWTTARRQRIGLMLAQPRHPAGLGVLLRHHLVRAARGLTRRFSLA